MGTKSLRVERCGGHLWGKLSLAPRQWTSRPFPGTWDSSSSLSHLYTCRGGQLRDGQDSLLCQKAKCQQQKAPPVFVLCETDGPDLRFQGPQNRTGAAGILGARRCLLLQPSHPLSLSTIPRPPWDKSLFPSRSILMRATSVFVLV